MTSTRTRRALLSYLDIRLLKFLPQGHTSREARHLGPRLVKYNSLKPIKDGSGCTIFHGQAVHIPMEAPILGDPIEEGLAAEDLVVEERIPKEPVLPNLTVEMVQKCFMALDHWFPAAQPIRGQDATRPTS